MRDATTGFSGDHVRDPCNHYFGAWDQGESELISGTWTPHQPFDFAMDRLHARSKRIRGSINPPPSRGIVMRDGGSDHPAADGPKYLVDAGMYQ